MEYVKEDMIAMNNAAIREILVSGMHCAGCAANVERNISKLEGVENATVNFSTGTARVVFDPERLRYRDLENAIENAGYGVVRERTEVRVEGMTCAGCARRVEDMLLKTDGVSQASVNLTSGTVSIEYNPASVSLEDVGKIIEAGGYVSHGSAEEAHEQRDAEAEHELQVKKWRALIGFVAGMLLMLAGYTKVSTLSWFAYAEFFFATPFFVYVSSPVFLAAWRALKSKNLTMDVMYAMGTGVAFLASVCATFGLVLSHEFLFYDTALMLASFLMLGRYLEARAKGKTGDAIRKLMDLRPHNALVIADGEEKEIPAERIRVQDTIVVKPGMRFPVDGIVEYGRSYVDESMITGEPMPVLRGKGDKVTGGTINKSSVIHFVATKIGRDTFLSQIIQMVKDAQGSKAPVQRIADVAVSYFIPVVLLIAILSALLWYFVFHSSFHFALSVLISVLVIACPCALGLATPAAVSVGVGRGAELGIFIKKAEALEISRKLTAVILDKTGTVTRGAPEVTEVISSGIDDSMLLRLAASLENNSRHPVASAIVKKAGAAGLEILPCVDFENVDGMGVAGVVSGQRIVAGSVQWMETHNVALPDGFHELEGKLQDEGKTTVCVAIDGAYRGMLAVADEIKATSKEAVAQFRTMGLKVIMMTGDSRRSALRVAQAVGIEEVMAEVLPHQKAEMVEALQKKGETVAFAGDGINDAPALARADVGIAMGGGTDVAIESGEMVLVSDSLTDAAAAIQLSRKVMARITQNLFWAFAYNVMLIPLAAGLLYPLSGVMFRPELAGLAMAMSSVTVLSLSLLLKKYTPPAKRLFLHP